MRFISEHWGDLIGLLLLYTGVLLVLMAATQLAGAQAVTHLGESLVLAGMGVLKLRAPAAAGRRNRHHEENTNEAPRSKVAANRARPSRSI